MDYQAFLKSKEIADKPTGFEVDISKLNQSAFEWQKPCIQWMLRRGRGALFQAPGLGKSIQQLIIAHEIVRKTNGKYIIFAPLCVAHQTVREASKFNIPDVKYVRDGSECDKSGIYISNYEMNEHFNPNEFQGVGADECFAPNTEVDCFENNIVIKKQIRYIREGEQVINPSGVDKINECHRRKVNRGVKVQFNGKSIVCSANHPWFTQRGWVAARSLRKTDWLLETTEAMRMVQGEFHSKECGQSQSEILREIMLSEMANESTGVPEVSHKGNARSNRQEEKRMVQIGKSSGDQGNREDPKSESNVRSECSIQSEPHIESNEPQTFRAWRKREGVDEAAITAAGGAIEWMGARICRISGKEKTRLSEQLQVRFGESADEDRDRGGWEFPSFSEGSRLEERFHAGFIRLDGIEILERGNPELEQFADSFGNIHFYDLGMSRHPSFSIGGALVHNSSIFKSKEGHYKTKFCEEWTGIPYRHCYTATPSPNDYAELGNHSELLGVMSRAEMEATFFYHDGGETSKWTLMPHAEEAFWKWVASWALLIRTPSDIGFSDEGYILPKLHVHEHIISSSECTDGYLIPMPAKTLTEQRKVKRDSIDGRCEWAARIATSDELPHVIWTELNDEGDILEELIPGSVQIAGKHSSQQKEERILAFCNGDFTKLVTKCSIAGYGINMQFSHNATRANITHSAEDMYQEMRRQYRFGQKEECNYHLVMTEAEQPILTNVKRKQEEAEYMAEKVVGYMRDSMIENITGSKRQRDFYSPQIKMELPKWLK